MTRTKSIDREKILDAAEAIVHESGAKALTLDLVAARSHISKGGLTYSFPSKDALLSAMLDRYIRNILQFQREFARAHPDVEFPELHDFLHRSRRGKPSIRRRMAPILAALSYSPTALNIGRVFHESMLGKLPTTTSSGRRARIVYLALHGLFLLQGMGLLNLSRESRELLLDDLAADLNGKPV